MYKNKKKAQVIHGGRVLGCKDLVLKQERSRLQCSTASLLNQYLYTQLRHIPTNLRLRIKKVCYLIPRSNRSTARGSAESFSLSNGVALYTSRRFLETKNLFFLHATSQSLDLYVFFASLALRVSLDIVNFVKSIILFLKIFLPNSPQNASFDAQK